MLFVLQWGGLNPVVDPPRGEVALLRDAMARASSGDQEARRSRSMARPYPLKKAEATEEAGPAFRVDVDADESDETGDGGLIEGKGARLAAVAVAEALRCIAVVVVAFVGTRLSDAIRSGTPGAYRGMGATGGAREAG